MGVGYKLRQVTANAFLLTFCPFVNVNPSDFTDYGRLWQAKTICSNHTQVLKEIIYPEWGLSKTLGISTVPRVLFLAIKNTDSAVKPSLCFCFISCWAEQIRGGCSVQPLRGVRQREALRCCHRADLQNMQGHRGRLSTDER